MERTYIADIKNNLGKPVLVQGFVENLRDSKYMAFIVLKDITGKIQITVEKEKLPELCPVIATLTQAQSPQPHGKDLHTPHPRVDDATGHHNRGEQDPNAPKGKRTYGKNPKNIIARRCVADGNAH